MKRPRPAERGLLDRSAEALADRFSPGYSMSPYMNGAANRFFW